MRDCCSETETPEWNVSEVNEPLIPNSIVKLLLIILPLGWVVRAFERNRFFLRDGYKNCDSPDTRSSSKGRKVAAIWRSPSVHNVHYKTQKTINQYR